MITSWRDLLKSGLRVTHPAANIVLMVYAQGPDDTIRDMGDVRCFSHRHVANPGTTAGPLPLGGKTQESRDVSGQEVLVVLHGGIFALIDAASMGLIMDSPYFNQVFCVEKRDAPQVGVGTGGYL